LDKLLTIPQYDRQGEPNTRLLPDIRPASFHKTAGVLPEEVQEYLAKSKPDANFLYLLIVALGAADYWGSNVNGDAFFEKDLLETQTLMESMKNPAPYTSQPMPRYKTFSFAKIRKHHQNKDHHPDYGHVELSSYDSNMKRVLLVVAVDRKKAPDIVAEAEAGNSIVWSMGCKVARDVCSICGNASKSVKDYCDHLKFQMNQMLPSGEKVYAVNPTPRFFDISKVLIPADKTAFTLMKVASEISSKALDFPDYYASIGDCEEMAKIASAQHLVVPSAFAAEHMKVAEKLSSDKTGEITKRIPAVTADNDLSDDAAQVKAVRKAHGISCGEYPLSDAAISSLGEFPLHQLLSSMAGLGMVAKPREFRRIVAIKNSKGAPKSEMNPVVLPEAVKTAAIKILAPFVEERSACSPWIEKRAGRTDVFAPECLSGTTNDLYVQYRNSLMNWDGRNTETIMSKHADLVIPPCDAEEDFFEAMVGVTKTAGVGKATATAGLAAIPLGSLFAPYMASAHLRLKSTYEGKPLEGVKKLVAKHPGTIGVTSAAGSALALAKLFGKI